MITKCQKCGEPHLGIATLCNSCTDKIMQSIRGNKATMKRIQKMAIDWKRLGR